MAIFIMRKTFPHSAWRQAFAAALIKLRPEMNPDAADEVSDTAYDTLCELPPADAAQSYVAGPDTRPPGPRQTGS